MARTKIKKREIVKIQYFMYCPKCCKEIKGNANSQVVYNLERHMEKCGVKK